MLKKLIITLIVGLVSVASIGCGNNDKNAANTKSDTQATSVKSTSRPTQAQIEKQITYWAGSSEKVESVKVDGHDIYIKIDLGNDTSVDLACTRFSNISDNLLKDNYWQNIKVSFKDLGIIEMNSSDAVGNDAKDKYFPNAEIRKHLKSDNEVQSKQDNDHDNNNNSNSDNNDSSKDTKEVKKDSNNSEHKKSSTKVSHHREKNNDNNDNNKNI